MDDAIVRTWAADLVTSIGAIEITVTATPFLQAWAVGSALKLGRRIANLQNKSTTTKKLVKGRKKGKIYMQR